MTDELHITVDGLRIYDRHGDYIKLTFQESRLLECLMHTYPRVAVYNFMIEWVWGDHEPANAKNSLVQAKSTLSRKLRQVGLDIEPDSCIGYRIIKLDSHIQNRQLFPRP